MSSTLTLEELADHDVDILEPRETLGVWHCGWCPCGNFTNISATNLAVAVNAGTINSSATAVAGQAILVG